MSRVVMVLIAFSLMVCGLASASQAAPLVATVASFDFVPANLPLTPGGVGTVDLRLVMAQNLAGYEVDLAFNPSIVVVDKVDRLIGTPTSPSPGRTWVSLPASGDPNITFIQVSPGVISFGAFSFGEGAGPNGDVLLARIHIRAVGTGTSSLHLNRTLVSDPNAIPSTPGSSDGSVTVSSAGCITGKVTLQGRTNHSGVSIASGPNAVSAADGTFALCGVVTGQRTITASHAGYISREIQINVTGAGQTLPDTSLLGGDADNSGSVNLFDLVLIAASYGSSPPTDVRADINASGTVDLVDLTLVGSNYAKTGPMAW